MATQIDIEAVKRELETIGSVYLGGGKGWVHKDPVRGRELVRQVKLYNRQTARNDARPPAWGPRGTRGTIICIQCGKRGQEAGTVCDHCGHAL